MSLNDQCFPAADGKSYMQQTVMMFCTDYESSAKLRIITIGKNKDATTGTVAIIYTQQKINCSLITLLVTKM